VLDRSGHFLTSARLINGPWQAFERDMARLMIAAGFSDVRVIGGTGDHGGDVLGVQEGALWVMQVKHTKSGPPPKAALDEVVVAGEYYQAARLAVAVSQPPSDAFLTHHRRFGDIGLTIDVFDPATLIQTASAVPEYSLHARKLRPYQLEACERMRDALLDVGRAQIVLATGLGKTLVMAELTASLLRDGLVQGEKVLVLAHTRELVDQLQTSFWTQLPKWVPTHRLIEGERPSFWEGITFSTIQSAFSRLDELPQFGLVLVDEAHHIGARSFVDLIEKLNPPMLCGVTATPWRGDGYDIDLALGAPVFKMGISEGLASGFLAEVDYRLLADNIDWEVVREKSQFRYSINELNRRLILPTRDEQAVRIIGDVWEQERRSAGLIFCASIQHAQAFAAMLRKFGMSAEAISSDTDPRERYALMARFRSGEIRFLATVDIFNEGVDVPDVDIIAFMRSTHSRRIFVQQLGRGLRVSLSKDKVVVLDFVTDLRRIADVLDLDRSLRGTSVEHLSLGNRLVSFTNRSAGTFLREWLLDQADLSLREGDATLELPHFDFPVAALPGSVQ
jgi:superfamily II DNA or RNA helicase